MAYLVEAADDICYTIIDFEDGINLGLIPEDLALEYLSKIISKRILPEKYAELKTTQNRIAYLRSLAIGELISEAVSLFMMHEEAILAGEFHTDLLSESKYKAQIKDIIEVSVSHIYKSQEVMDKEIAGYKILTTMLHDFTTAIEHQLSDNATNFDSLIIANFLSHLDFENMSTEKWLIEVSSHIASMTDSEALRTYKKLNGNNL